MKIQLIRPPFDDWYEHSTQLDEFVGPPIGLALLARSVKRHPDIKVEIIDALNEPIDEVVKKIDGTYVGVSSMYATHLNSLKILKEAENKGAFTIMGGHNVSFLSKNILRNHDYVHYVVVGDGEKALPMLIEGENDKDIPNLVYRTRTNGIVRNKKENVPLDLLFDLEDILDLKLNKNNALLLSSIRGCVKAEEKSRCHFCSIDHKLTTMEPKLVWEQISILNAKHDISYFWETGDSFMVDNFPEKLLATRPNYLEDVSFRIYTSPNQLNEENVQVLKDLNVTNLFIGIESTNNNVLRGSGKGYNKKDIEYCSDLVKDHDWTVNFPFILGLPGTTMKTLEEDYKFAQKVTDEYNEIMMTLSLPVLFPGTRLFNNVRRHPQTVYNGDLYKDDFFNYRQLFEQHVKHFTDVDTKTLYEYHEKFSNLIDKKGNITSFSLNR